jgi:hypothetical protein
MYPGLVGLGGQGLTRQVGGKLMNTILSNHVNKYIYYYTILYYTTLLLYYAILYYTILLYYCYCYCYGYVVLYYTMLYCSNLNYTIPYYTILYYAMLCSAMLSYTILYYIVLYYTMLYYTKLYYPSGKNVSPGGSFPPCPENMGVYSWMPFPRGRTYRAVGTAFSSSMDAAHI